MRSEREVVIALGEGSIVFYLGASSMFLYTQVRVPKAEFHLRVQLFDEGTHISSHIHNLRLSMGKSFDDVGLRDFHQLNFA